MKRLVLFFLAFVSANLSLLVVAVYAQPVIPTTHPRILLLGTELQRLRADLTANAPAAVRFRDMVDRAVGGDNGIYAYEPWFSAMMGVVTQVPAKRQSYCGHAVTQMEAIVLSEEALISGGGKPDVSGDSYLEAGYFIGNVAKVYDWCNEFVSAGQATRWLSYANQALVNIRAPDAATWGGRSYPWSGWSIDNPANNYYYSFLRAAMLYGLAAKYDRADADTWINHFRTVKIGNQLVPVFNSDLSGGGSREGTGYGTAMGKLFNLYYEWEKSTGERIADLTPHTAASMHYLVHAIAPTRDRFAPIGDHSRDETATFFDYQREALLALATLYRGAPVARRVRAELALTNVPTMGQQFEYVYDYLYGASDAGAAADLNTVYRGSGTGHLFARSDWSKTATWLGFLNGPYTESHAHPDGLSILLYKNGWLVNDANMQSKSGLSQEQASHAVVTQKVNGQLIEMYQPSTSTAQLTALAQRPSYIYSAANAGTLFDHPNTGNPGAKSKREVLYILPNTVVVFDRVQYTPGTSTKTFHLPTAYLPTISGRTVTLSNGVSGLKLFALQPTSASISNTLLSSVDPDLRDGYRIDVSLASSGETKFMNVLSIDNAVTTAQNNSGDDLSLQLADGRSVLVRFNPTAPGGTIEIRDGAGQVLVSEPLASTVQSLPLLATLAQQKTLTLTKSGAGTGNISSAPSGISCGAVCSAAFDVGTTVTLTATPNTGFVFTSWSGGGCSGVSTCQININADVAVTATFGISVQTVPSAPQNLVCIAGVAQAQCSFSPPANLGVPVLNGYTLSCVIDNGNNVDVYNFGAANSPVTATGLPTSRVLSCAVKAVNSAGVSSPSNIVTVIPYTSLSLRGGVDTNSDGKGELFVRNAVVGLSYIGSFDTARNQIIFQPTVDAGPEWRVLGTGDFGGRGTSDLPIQNIAHGDVKFWKGFSFAPDNERIVRNVKPGWQVEAIADIDGDGKSDIVWRFYSTPANPSPNPDDNGVVFVWFMNDGAINEVKHRGGAPINWRLFGAADLSGAGQANLIWISPQNAVRSIAARPNRAFFNELIGTVPAGYQLSRLGDFNGDGKSDLLFSNNQGKMKLWIMDGIAIRQRIDLPDTDATWSLFAVADLNGDGTVDLVFRKPDNSLVIWLMNAATPAMPTVINNAGVLPLGVENIDPACTGSCS